MASRQNQHYLQRTRDRISKAKLEQKVLRYLDADPKGENGPKPGDIMTATQVHVAMALLRKIIPDIASQTLVVQDERQSPRTLTMVAIEQRLNELAPPPVNKTLQ